MPPPCAASSLPSSDPRGDEEGSASSGTTSCVAGTEATPRDSVPVTPPRAAWRAASSWGWAGVRRSATWPAEGTHRVLLHGTAPGRGSRRVGV